MKIITLHVHNNKCAHYLLLATGPPQDRAGVMTRQGEASEVTGLAEDNGQRSDPPCPFNGGQLCVGVLEGLQIAKDSIQFVMNDS